VKKNSKNVLVSLFYLTIMICICILSAYNMSSIIYSKDNITIFQNTIRSGNYEYCVLDENNKTASLTRVYDYTDEVILPATIDDYKIVSIGVNSDDKYAQGLYSVVDKEDTTIKKLVIPEGVTTIEASAFYKMNNLETLQFPSTLKRIKSENFLDAKNIKILNLCDGIVIMDYCFDNSVINELDVTGSVETDSYAHDDSIPGMGGTIKKLFVKSNGQKRSVLNLGHANIKKTVVDSSIDSILIDGKYDNIKLKNSETKVEYDEHDATIKKITAVISNVKRSKKSGKYVYSWKPLKVSMSYWRLAGSGIKNMKSKVTYRIQRKQNNKFKTIKTTKKQKIKLNSKVKLKVSAEFN